ncbi:MAG: rod shape-determining protein MreD [Prolixibacteraceae bacterium]|nr:rod shape-determining protein MreD [Prolixibacteraceae bacterium]MBN2773823.1 rod shape-determining protein MreD [Prolixibacteraceae bacterium]
MIRIWIKYGIMFVSLVLLQVLILNFIQFSGYINPYMYVLFILLLPISTPRYFVVILGFILGLVIDIFSNTVGMHASATTFMAFARPIVIELISSREMDKSDYPGLNQYGFQWFLYYSAILVFLHHIFFFYVEAFTFVNFIHTFIRSILSSVFSIFIIVLSQYLVFRE